MGLTEVIEEVRQEIAAAGSGITEADAKTAFITPILAELGWRGLRRIRSEYPVDQGRMRLDYALIGSSDKPVALIEAKAPREDLESHVAQVLNYAFHEGVDVCVLTTGIAWWLYLPREKGNPAERRFAALDLQIDGATEVAALFESCLEYQALTTGAAERRAKEMLAAQQLERRVLQEIPRAWQRLLAGPHEMLIELVQEEVQDVLGARPSQEQVSEALRNTPARASAPTVAEPRVRPTPTSRSARPLSMPGRTARRGKAPSKTVTEFRLWGRPHPVRYQYQVLAMVADLVYDRHKDDFDRVLPLSRFQYGEEGFIRPHQIGASSFCVETNLDFNSMKQTCERLLEQFGYSANDLEIVAED